MASPGGFSPITVALLAPAPLAGGLRIGQVYEGLLQRGANNRPAVVINGQNYPIQSAAGFQHGQRLQVEVTGEPGALQFRLTPRPPATGFPAASKPAFDSVWNALARVLDNLGALNASSKAVHLLPSKMPPTEANIRLVMSLFLNRESVGEDLAVLRGIVEQAAQAGALSREQSLPLVTMAGQWTISGEGGIFESLQRWVQNATRALEGRIAQALETGRLQEAVEGMGRDIRTRLHRLSQDETFTRFLRQEGRLSEFQQASSRILDRFSAMQAQNLRQLELPYLFFEIPVDPSSGLKHGQIHILGEGGQGREGSGRRNATIAFDMATTHLGDLWITLALWHGHCTCLIRTSKPDILDMVHEASGELKSGLQDAGYDAATVQVRLWDGDRLNEVAQLMRGFSGFEAEA